MGTRVISFLYIIYLARTLGVSDFGLLTVALAYFSIVSSIADFGFNRFLIREVAKKKSRAPELLWNIVFLRLFLTSLFFAIFSLALYLLDPDKVRVSLILLATLAILPQSAALTFDAIFVGFQKLQFSAISIFISGLSTALAGLILVGNGFGPTGAISALIFGQIIYILTLILFLYKTKALIFSPVNLSIIKKALIGSLPYGILGILGLLYFRIDTVMLAYIKGSFETGIYGVAYKFLEAVTVIPSAFFASIFPALAKMQTSDVAQVKRLYFKSLKIMVGLGILVLLGYIFVLPQIIKTLLPNYGLSIKAIMILSLSIPFMFAQVPGVGVLLSSDKYLKSVLWLSILTLSFNVILNLIFIPKYGYLAAAWVTVASEILTLLVFFNLLRIKVLAK
ncbi:MAG: O-antigen transporter related protein, partial [Microgenomates group bacterium Gr01-1014_7]